MTDKYDIMGMMTGYRDLIVMNHIVTGKDDNLVKDIPVQYRILAERMPHYIQYQYQNLIKWLGYFKGKLPSDVHGTDLLPLYVKGLGERNKFCWFDVNMKEWCSFAMGKVVMDVGYGSGFYSRLFCKCTNKGDSVYGIEKDDVADYVKKNIPLPDNFIRLDMGEVKNLSKGFDVIFLSEVLHGRTPEQIKTMVMTYAKHLRNDGIVVINELNQDTALGRLFSINMTVHNKGGKLYSEQEIKSILGFKSIEVYRTSEYHWTMGGRPNVNP